MSGELDGEYVEYVSARLAAMGRLAYQLCGDKHRADDLVQQTITKLYERWRKIRGFDGLDQYVRTMLVRTFLDEKRGAWSSRVSLVEHLPDQPAPGTLDVEQRTMLRGALAGIPRRQRAALVLRFLCDLSVEEVARLLGCTTGNVKSLTHRGLESLRRELGAPGLAALELGD